jgi:hypothetical protein
MFITLQALTIIVVASACAFSLAHALALPGKRRLDKETYDAVQPIDYPGFTMGGVSEPAGILLTVVLFMTPFGSTPFWLTLVALLCLLAQQAVYWFVLHPVKQCWVEGQHINRLGAGFFSFGTQAPRAMKNIESLPRDLEIQLALSALPAHLRENATVYVLTPGKGFEVARKGTNGFHALVARTGDDAFRGSWPLTQYRDDILYPISFDTAGATAPM